jgi:tRNA(Ile)-lysidine synthase
VSAAEAATENLTSGGPLSAAELDALFAPFADQTRVLLAVSGGPDSTALLLLAARWRSLGPARPELLVATVDHGLRPESRLEAEAVGQLAARLGLPHAVLELSTPLPRTGLQEAARDARYERLAAHARMIGAGAIATGHTADDQAETVLFRLMRGSGLSGLAGIPAVRTLDELCLIRPLLALRKDRLIALCRDAGVDFVRDPSNRDPRFARARLRQLLPLLADEGLDAGRLARLATRLARADAALEAATDEAAARLMDGDAPPRIARAGLDALPDEIGLRLLSRALERQAAGPVELAKLEALHSWIAGLAPEASGARTLAGALVRVDTRWVKIARAPARRAK